VTSLEISNTFEASEIPKISITLLPLTPVAKRSETSMYWHSIFSHMVIAYDFPIPDHHEEQGLEIAFDTMVQLTRCLCLTQYDNAWLLRVLSVY
jgi:hypothetical protein